MSALSCLTAASEIRGLLRKGRHRLWLEFECFDRIIYRNVVLAGIHPGCGGADRVTVLLRNAVSVSLVLSPEGPGSNTVKILDPNRAAPAVVSTDLSPPIELLALEEYMRWQDALIIRRWPERIDYGPYADHPRVRELPLVAREQLAYDISRGRVLSAVMVIKE